MTVSLAFEYRRGKTKYQETDETPLVSKLDIDYSILSEAVVYRLRRAQLSVVSDFNESLLAFGLRPADFSVLIVVANNTGLKQSDVAEALGIQRANFVAIIDGLEDKRLLQRRRSDSDRRVHYLEMTEEGRSVLEEISQIWKDHEDKLVDRLGGEKARDQLIGLLRRIKD
ncbi:MarR family winged helix-turn-helix transcriptional regulator [Agrobacterium sp. rho-13.3]|jgi:DNA-binding MarR family transcriptional regulator|uniref:MarR family winged helix-turn-helix transcriptional regulator n=1 Tax=Agrobacterium sp. rho-13.3 TaxID=3072980 RepID=UPI002A0CFB1D|nr:MarR family winged helix-turn-helix transcriptional regulator [Agrobacterium sp. rho-13.3]MDX8307912.1 MarR family winged helix-turn-helix transcriptional regulator [Agrobacterium sp. rho-13.3]